MSKRQSHSKSRGSVSGGFAGIPRVVMKHPDYISLSTSSKALLMEAAYQYRGQNNGDITFAWAILSKRGFKSRTTIDKAKKKLISAGLIIETRRGKFTNPGGICSLYALAWCPINECSGKLDVKATITPPRKFSFEKNK